MELFFFSLDYVSFWIYLDAYAVSFVSWIFMQFMGMPTKMELVEPFPLILINFFEHVIASSLSIDDRIPLLPADFDHSEPIRHGLLPYPNLNFISILDLQPQREFSW